MDRSCAATILSEVEQASKSGTERLLQNNQPIFKTCFGLWPR